LRSLLLLFFILIFSQCSCDSKPYFSKNSGCKTCHKVEIDASHDFSCSKCHNGNENSIKIHSAHKNLVANPAHPDLMMDYCGKCHKNEVINAQNSSHFTLENEISITWQAFFPDDLHVNNIKSLPFASNPKTEKEVLSEVLRKRCLLCHPYYKGEDYTGTRRGTGCASCHLQNRLLEPQNHRFDNKISDKHCLSCHYGNFTGWDYYGRFEKDFEEDFRDIIDGKPDERNYGVEWHELNPDVHMKAGLSCTDCHLKNPCNSLKKHENKASCINCHLNENNKGFLRSKLINKERKGHRKQDLNKVSCSVCHALWSFNDTGRNITHSFSPDYYTWMYLMIQGSSEIEKYFNLYDGNNQPLPLMTDKFNGSFSHGLWFMGFYERRWLPVKTGMSDYRSKNKIYVLRPLLDITITYYNKEIDKSFKLIPQKNILIPYFPHTIGKPDFNRVIEMEKVLE